MNKPMQESEINRLTNIIKIKDKMIEIQNESWCVEVGIYKDSEKLIQIKELEIEAMEQLGEIND